MEKENTKEKGKASEELAADLLIKKGYLLKEKNWRSGRLEVDLIFETQKELVFVEVKSRYSPNYGGAWEAVNHEKRKKIMRAAHVYITRFDVKKEPRFDIVSITMHDGKSTIEHIEGAFWPMA
jgi:putative endonuclease